jgi:hypothetical protein
LAAVAADSVVSGRVVSGSGSGLTRRTVGAAMKNGSGLSAIESKVLGGDSGRFAVTGEEGCGCVKTPVHGVGLISASTEGCGRVNTPVHGVGLISASTGDGSWGGGGFLRERAGVRNGDGGGGLALTGGI